MSDENETLERLRDELRGWRARLDHLRVQANLGRRDARDKLDELQQRLEPSFQKARRYLEQAAASGSEEARTLGKSLLAGWEEVRRTHRDLSHAAGRERPEARERSTT